MKNPFLFYSEQEKTEYVTALCSVNRGVIAYIPVKGIADDIIGKSVNDVFSAGLISQEIKTLAGKWGVDLSAYTDKDLPRFLDDATCSNDIIQKTLADSIVRKFGNRLGVILLTLKQGHELNRQARKDWSSEHWDYWANIKTVILTGGLSSGLLGRRFKEQILYVFDMAGEKPYNINLYDNGSHLGVMGCAKLLPDDCSGAAVLDFGQTNLKRSVIRKRRGDISEFIQLRTRPSLYMELDTSDSPENHAKAVELHKYLVKIVVDTCREAMATGDLCCDVIISIANYAVGNRLFKDRGGYAKLFNISDEYGALLAHDVSSALHRQIRIRLVHDGTAIALNFTDREDTVCLSMGTAFGVGFTDIRLPGCSCNCC
ncbi:MAG: hypothetical protein E7563_05465 [Ruminococcaceae bacterium]|nr:hypothetical protein [Oscillospiraceae bacterium]